MTLSQLPVSDSQALAETCRRPIDSTLMFETAIWRDSSARMRASAPYRRLKEAIESGDPLVQLERTPLPVAAWCLELLRQDLGRPVLALVPRESDAVAWVEAARLLGAPGDPEAVTDFPSPSLTPYQEARAALMVRAGEARALDALFAAQSPGVVCTPRALFQRLPVRRDFTDRIVTLSTGDEIAVETLVAKLEDAGYLRADLVAEVGMYAVRGGVLDLWPPARDRPVRLDFFGDEIESVRAFDPATQRSDAMSGEGSASAPADGAQTVRIRPLGLFAVGEAEAMDLAEVLEDEAPVDFVGAARERLDLLARGGHFPGWENWLPLVHDTISLHQALEDPLIALFEPSILAGEVRHHGALLEQEYEARLEQGLLVVPPEELATPVDEVDETFSLATLQVGDVVVGGDTGAEVSIDFEATATENLQRHLQRFPREVETARDRGDRLLLVAPPENHNRLSEWLERGPGEEDLTPWVGLASGELASGFRLPALELVLFGEEQLFPRRSARGKSGPKRFGPFLADLRDLKVGDFVVHEDHGIGQFLGIRSLGAAAEPALGTSDLPPAIAGLEEIGGGAVEVMEIVYAQERALLLPLDRIHQIQKYSGLDALVPRLDKLGGSSWAKKKSRVKKGLQALATDLLKLYAERELAEAPAMPPDSDSQNQFEASFEHQETDDQLEAATAIKADLERAKPMDRLLCGDVGFGKTEVAMRAAFKVVDAGYQVAILAPTTILADQHLQTFKRRFAGFPIEVEMISRFRTAAEVREVRERVAAGKVQILIGTHRLLSRDIDIPMLALMIVDEEQRFGVGQKEKLKELKKNIHVLAMSATPVPRTLQLSLAGVRDLSVIETPPRDRMAVETRIVPFGADLVKEAIEYELEREGQVYYVYNRVENIEEVSGWLRELVPGVRITVGHGQMDEQELARRMHAFTRGEHDVLLATTIIENGIDIPNVNTMLVHRADRFGLAQLYQLRGRVGRSDQLAYCYMMVSSDKVLTEVARKRLEAIREFTDLGAGFRIAARDLEIRGAGNLLGAEQSGHIAELGIETYLKMLEDTVRELRGETIEEAPSATIDLPVMTTIPSEYIAETNLRMEIYRRLASSHEDIDEVLTELRDRFGPPPESVLTLVRAASLKQLAEELRVQSVSSRGTTLSIRMRQDARVDLDTLIRFVSEHESATFSPTGVLTLEGVSPGTSLDVARRTLEHIAPATLTPAGVAAAAVDSAPTESPWVN